MSDHIQLIVNGVTVYESSIGTKPPVTPPPPPPPPPKPIPPRSTVNYSLFMGLTLAQARLQRLHETVPGWSYEEFARSGFMEGDYDAAIVADTDKRTIRDLSSINGPAVVEGYAGHVEYITCNRPIDEVVEITCGRTNSALGAITSATLSVANADILHYDPPSGSDCYGKIKYVSTGNNQIRVELHTPGALAVQRN